MITQNLDQTVISVDFSGFHQQDTEYFERYLNLWFTMATGPYAVRHAPNDFLLKTLNENSIALGESSDTISKKWADLFNKNQIWKMLFKRSPFKVSIQKVCPISLRMLTNYIKYVKSFFLILDLFDNFYYCSNSNYRC